MRRLDRDNSRLRWDVKLRGGRNNELLEVDHDAAQHKFERSWGRGFGPTETKGRIDARQEVFNCFRSLVAEGTGSVRIWVVIP